jgi:hypothetical protein
MTSRCIFRQEIIADGSSTVTTIRPLIELFAPDRLLNGALISIDAMAINGAEARAITAERPTLWAL